MRRFDVIPITSEFSENPNVRITTLCCVPLLGYIYAGTNLGDIILYKYNDLDKLNAESSDYFCTNIDRERIKSSEKAVKVRNISQKCKKIDKVFPIISYDAIIDENMQNKVHIGGIIMCLCDGNLLYIDIELKGSITLLNKGVTSVSVWKDSYNINEFQTKFCVSTRKKIIFYNTCILGDFMDIDKLIEEQGVGCSESYDNSNSGSSLNENKIIVIDGSTRGTKNESREESSNSSYSWFGFSAKQKPQSNTDDSGINKRSLSKADDHIRNIEFVKVEEFPIPSRLASFSENISNIEWCDNWICFVLGNTYFIMNIDDQKINEVLSIDQMDGEFRHNIVILPEKEFMLTCQDNLGVFFSLNTLEPCPKSMIQWPSESLTGVVLSQPYLLGSTKSGIIQIYSLNSNGDELNNKNQKDFLENGYSNSQGSNSRKSSIGGGSQYSLQTLQLDDEITSISTGCTCEGLLLTPSTKNVPLGPITMVSTLSKIYLLVPIPIEESIFELVNRNQRKQALSLISTYCNNNNLLFNSLLFKTQCLIGWFEFRNLNFQSAFNYFKEAHIDPRVIIILFWKELIPVDDIFGNISIKENDDIYEYASLPWSNSKGNTISENLTPDLRYHESILRSILRIGKNKKLPRSINQFVQKILNCKTEYASYGNFMVDFDCDMNKIDDYIYSANENLKLFILNERNRYPSSKNIQNKNNNPSCSTGRIMDIVYMKLVIDESNNQVCSSHSDKIAYNNRVIFSLLDINDDVKKNVENLILTEFDLDKYEKFLVSNRRYDILAVLLSRKSMYLKSLEILENIINSGEADDCDSKSILNEYEKKDSEYINIYVMIYKILFHMCSCDNTPVHVQANLLKRYSRYILDKPEVTNIEDLFTVKPIEKYPLNIDEILHLFNYFGEKVSSKLKRSYLEKIISRQNNIEIKYKIDLIEIYISEIYNLDPNFNSNLELDGKTPTSSYCFLFTEKYKPSKLLLMLEEIDYFDSESIFKNIIYDEKTHKYGVHYMIIIEYILVLFRCSQHKQALSYIINVLDDIQLAEIYTIVWNVHNKYYFNKAHSYNNDKGFAFNSTEQYKNSEIVGYDSHYGNTEFNETLFFSEFKFWRKYVEEYSDSNNKFCEKDKYSYISSWMDILDISKNELSLVSSNENICRNAEFDYNKRSLRNIISEASFFSFDNYVITSSKSKKDESLVILIKTLVDAWRSKNNVNIEKAKTYKDATLNILNKYSLHCDLDIHDVLQVIPEEWPLLNVIDFFKKSLVKHIHDNNTNVISTDLSAISYLRFYEKWSNFKSNHITITQDMICNICSLKLGNKQCALYPNGTCIHTHCLSSEHNSAGIHK
ncbi:hypothetical protein FG386_002336 [Cryptosporidium ryanae]|uniref:uncharacterized protein n=1 Tax=Cryptosporidium ryanae TaxID=515981 RepID=UPI00351A7DDF|nr:hypothetical protein FG386_002336 [Cryptosporidium ryanae]